MTITNGRDPALIQSLSVVAGGSAVQWMHFLWNFGHTGLFAQGHLRQPGDGGGERRDWIYQLLRVGTPYVHGRARRSSQYVFKLATMIKAVPTGGKPDWKDDSPAIPLTLHTASLNRLLHVAVNALWGPLLFALPASGVAVPLGWRRLVDTLLASPYDIVESESGVVVMDDRYLANSHSIVVLQTSCKLGFRGPQMRMA